MKRPFLGVATILFALGFNAPYAVLAARFDYPDILRRDATYVLQAFAEGGAPLLLVWYSFGIFAFLFTPLSVALASDARRLATRPEVALIAAMTGALAGVVQAVGLFRWTFIVPMLANAEKADELGRRLAEHSFFILNAYSGVAIGEHLGQLLTAAFVLSMSIAQSQERRPFSSVLGFTTATGIALGAGEGLAVALGVHGDAFTNVTIAAYLALTCWLIATGISLIAPQPRKWKWLGALHQIARRSK